MANLLIIIALSFRILLDICYVSYLSVDFEYMGFYLDLNFFKLLESYLLTLFLFFFVPKSSDKISSIVLTILYYFMILPSHTLYAMLDLDRGYIYLTSFGFLLTLIITKLPTISISFLRWNNKLTLLFLILITVLTYSVLLILNGLPSSDAFNLLEVYEIRENVEYRFAFMYYLVAWQVSVVNFFLFGLFLYKKKYNWILAPLGLQILAFMITGHKSYLFSIPLLFILLLIVIKGNKKNFHRNFGFIFIGVAMFCLVFYHWWNFSVVASLFIRRTLFVPALNNYYYYDFFSRNEHVQLSNSIFSFFVENPYNTPIPLLIGKEYYDRSDMWVNTGYLGDAYMNFGSAGMILFSILLAIILLFADSISKEIDITIVLCTLLICSFNLINGALLTTMMNGGFLLGLLILYLYRFTAFTAIKKYRDVKS